MEKSAQTQHGLWVENMCLGRKRQTNTSPAAGGVSSLQDAMFTKDSCGLGDDVHRTSQRRLFCSQSTSYGGNHPAFASLQ